MARILVIDDDPVILEVITEILKMNKYEVVAARNGKSGFKELQSNHYDLVLSDLVMPDVGGMDLLEQVVEKFPNSPCIILTGYGSIKSSVEAIKKGAFDYITKPITSSELLMVIEKALKFKNLEEENIKEEVSLIEAKAADKTNHDHELERFIKDLAVTANVAVFKFYRGDYL